MLMEGGVKFFSPQKTAGVTKVYSVLVVFQTKVVNGDQLSKIF